MLSKIDLLQHQPIKKLTLSVAAGLLALSYLGVNVQAAEDENHQEQNTEQQQPAENFKFTTQKEIQDKIKHGEPIDLNDPNAPVDPTEDLLYYQYTEMIARVKRKISVKEPATDSEANSEQKWTYTAPDRDRISNEEEEKFKPNTSLTNAEKKNDAGQIIYLVRGGSIGNSDDFWTYDTDWTFGTITFHETKYMVTATVTPYTDGRKIEFKDWIIPEIDGYTPEDKNGIDNPGWKKSATNAQGQSIIKGQSFDSVADLLNHTDPYKQEKYLHDINGEMHFNRSLFQYREEYPDTFENKLTEDNHYYVRYVVPKDDPQTEAQTPPNTPDNKPESDPKPENPTSPLVPDVNQTDDRQDIPKTPDLDQENKQKNIPKTPNSDLNSKRTDKKLNTPVQEKMSSSKTNTLNSNPKVPVQIDQAKDNIALPQTGNKSSFTAILGLALTSLAGLMGTTFRKKH